MPSKVRKCLRPEYHATSHLHDKRHTAAAGISELAAEAALSALEHGWDTVHDAHAAARARAFNGKWRFNRALRSVVASRAALSLGGVGARLVPGALRAIVARAGDCHQAA